MLLLLWWGVCEVEATLLPFVDQEALLTSPCIHTLRGVLYQFPLSLSDHWLDKVKDLCLLSADTLSTQKSFCSINSKHTFFLHHLSYCPFFLLLIHRCCKYSSPLGNCGDSDNTTCAEYQHTHNAIFHGFSWEQVKEDNGRKRQLMVAEVDVDSVGWGNEEGVVSQTYWKQSESTPQTKPIHKCNTTLTEVTMDPFYGHLLVLIHTLALSEISQILYLVLFSELSACESY